MAQVEKPSVSLGERLQSLPKPVLYLILVCVTTIPLFFSMSVPSKPEECTMDLYKVLMNIPEGKTVLISSDWTNSTRGESAGSFEAVMRILMQRKAKICIFTAADAQAPQVARDEITAMNADRRNNGEQPYEEWNDYLVLGYFPNAEGTLNAIRANVREAFSGKKAMRPNNGGMASVIDSPVLKDINRVEDFPLVIVSTASNTSNIVIERLSGKVPIAMTVTGVMGPETQVYYSSGQLVGLSKGLKGVFDLELMMTNGVNYPNGDAALVKAEKWKSESVPPTPGKQKVGKGSTYYPTLHFALALLIVAVLVGNIGMIISRRKGA